MGFLAYLFVGFLSGVIGGMGMGGGTILIPALTILLGVNQRIAQAANVISFLPMAFFALAQHKKNGLLKTEGSLSIILPALITTVIGGIIMTALPVHVLKKLFGFFLIALAVKQAFGLPSYFKSR